MRNFIQEGICLTYPATAAVTSGDLVIEGAIVGVAAHDAEIGEDSTIRIEGVFSLPKAAATALIFGQPVAWVAGAVAASGGNSIGVAAAQASPGDSVAYVLLGYHGGGTVALSAPATKKSAA